MSLQSDFIEIDFLAVETGKSGDAITIQYGVAGIFYIHVVDGGYTDMGETIDAHLKANYSSQDYIDHVVLTHSDQDHAKGLKYILENRRVNNLWMNRPWLYASDIIQYFKNYNSVSALESRLRSIYSSVAELEEIAIKKGIPIWETFQGAMIGPKFQVLAPSRTRYLSLIVDSDRTPEIVETALASTSNIFDQIFKTVSNFVKAAWNQEYFPATETSAENEMSVVQYAEFGGKRFLLTGDGGRGALREAADYAPYASLFLPGIDRFQVPHHGSRRNVSTELLDKWLGPRLNSPLPSGSEKFIAIISSAAEDTHHPRKSVVRAMYHRGGFVAATEGNSLRTDWNAPDRVGWNAVSPMPYPDEQEE